MTFREGARILRSKLRHAGFAATGDPYDTSKLEKGRAVADIEVIARKDYYDVVYLETESNWRGISADVAKNNLHPCLVIARYGDRHTILSTTTDHYARDRKVRYVVVDNGAKKYSVSRFIRSIRSGPGDDTGSVDAKVQKAFDEFSAYKEAMDNFAGNLDDIIKTTIAVVEKGIEGNERYAARMGSLLGMCREVISAGMDEDDIRDMLVQHILTYGIFEMVYDAHDFHATNALAKSLELLKETLGIPDRHVDYETMELIAESLKDTRERQEFLKRVYETFYAKYDSKTADRDGIVYTPSEVVDFMVESTEMLLKERFGKSFSDDGVIMLDPFTGTGTFIVHALERISLDKIKTKYENDLHANEKYILPYYIASLNIEHAYLEKTGEEAEFEGMCWMDTFESGAKNYEDMLAFLDNDNVRRITRQQGLKINVIIGNPPYSMGQGNANDDNQNLRYDALDKKIDDTYIKATRQFHDIGHVGSMYDSYIRAFRWASDRLGEFGIIAFVTNSGFLRSDTAAGFRACLHEEFTEVWCFDLLGKKGAPGNGRNIFEYSGVSEGGTTTGVVITILVKSQDVQKHTIHYAKLRDIDYSGKEKRNRVKELGSIFGINDWIERIPDEKHYWLDQPGVAGRLFEKYVPMGSKKGKKGNDKNVIFRTYSRGVATSRDVWVYNSSVENLTKNVRCHIDYCNEQDLDDFKIEPKRGKFDGEIADKMKRLEYKMSFDENKTRIATYRPFVERYLYFDKILNLRQYLIPTMFPENDTKNLAIVVPYKFNGEFSAFMVNTTSDLEVVHHGQCFPLYTYGKDGKKTDNITQHALQIFRHHYGTNNIKKIDIFHYIYAMLHHKGYRETFANVLTRGLPRMPLAPNFGRFTRIGRELAKLHLEYKKGPMYKLKEPLSKIPDAPKTIGFGKKNNSGAGPKRIPDTSTLYIDKKKIYDNLPVISYRVNKRTPLEWFAVKSQFNKDNESGITNHPLEGISGEEIRKIIARLAYVGVESDRLMAELAEEDFEQREWKLAKAGLDAHIPDAPGHEFQSRLA